MNEHLNKLPPEVLDALNRAMKAANDKGRLIEVGWLSLRVAAIPAEAPEVQLAEMRQAFFAGAQHLFSSLMAIMDADREPTAKDLERMDLIQRELDEFISVFAAEHLPTAGRA